MASADASPIQRVKVAFTAIAVAEYFRDLGKNVLFMMDSITRFAQAQREIGLAAGEPPTSKGYCPSVFSLLPKLTERLGAADRGSITGIFTILVEGDEMDDPIADSVRSLLDGHIVLSRKLAEMGHYPAVDVLGSISRLMNSIIGKNHLAAAQKMRAIYSTYQRAEDLINIGAVAPGANPRLDRAVALIDKVNQFLIQPIGQSCRFERTVRLDGGDCAGVGRARGGAFGGAVRCADEAVLLAIAAAFGPGAPEGAGAGGPALARLAAEIAALRQEARRLREDISRRLRELSAVALAERLRRREMFAVWSGAGAGDHTALVGGADTG